MKFLYHQGFFHVQSIERAHENLQEGSLEFAYGELLEANINRSPTSYLYNPAEERAKYKHDVDKEMTLLKLLGADGRCAALGARAGPRAGRCQAANQGRPVPPGRSALETRVGEWASGHV